MSRPRELLTDYARGSLSKAETIRLEEHLESCASCRGEVRDILESFVELVEGLPAAPPPPRAWDGIVERVRQQRLRGSRRVAWSLAASLLIMAGAGVWGLQALGRSTQASIEAQTVARWLAQEDTTRLSLGIYPGGGHGSILLLPDDRALFVLSEPPARGMGYQAWGHSEDATESLGVFHRPVFEVSSEGFDSLGVSLEPRNGSPAPTHRLGRTELP